MAALDEADLKLILGDKYVEKTAAEKLADSQPKGLRALWKKLFTK